MSVTSRSPTSRVSTNSKPGTYQRTMRRRSARRLYAVSLAAAAVPMAMHVQDARANITGFGDANWTFNNTATLIDPSTLELTQPVNSLANTAFNSVLQDITNFTASFTYMGTAGADLGGGGAADGIAFIVQNDTNGVGAVGGGGGALGYSGITNSAAFEINIYSPNNRGIANHSNGATGGYITVPGVDLLAAPVNVTIQYNGAYAKETITQGTNSAVFYGLSDLQTSVGGTSALVGFSGGTGGENAEQQVTNFSFVNGTNTAVTIGPDYHWYNADSRWTHHVALDSDTGHPRGIAST